MAMVCGLDLHRRQITLDTLEVGSGEEWRGRIGQPDRARFRRWLRDDVARRANDEVALAVEGCTGWRHVVEEITAAGFEAHVAEPADMIDVTDAEARPLKKELTRLGTRHCMPSDLGFCGRVGEI